MNAVISPTILRIIIALLGAALLVAIYLFGRPRQRKSGRRLPPGPREEERIEPVLGDAEVDGAAGAAADPAPRQGELDVALKRELDRLGATVTAEHRGHEDAAVDKPIVGRRPQEQPVERIVTLFVAARDGESFGGGDVVVAAEKAGLRFGAMRIFHRLVEGRAEAGPIFSMANMLKPGYFDMASIGELATPGVTFFATLPGPLPALDAWEAMLPAAQRIAGLLDGVLLDGDRNALGRQRIAGLREELRAWDRQREGDPIRTRPQW